MKIYILYNNPMNNWFFAYKIDNKWKVCKRKFLSLNPNLGQFISSNWFKINTNSLKNHEFMIINDNRVINSFEIQKKINLHGVDKLENFVQKCEKYKFCEDQIKIIKSELLKNNDVDNVTLSIELFGMTYKLVLGIEILQEHVVNAKNDKLYEFYITVPEFYLYQ